MTRLILAAGVAALAITAPASAKPDRQGDRGERAQVEKQGQRAQAAQRVQRTERVRAERPARIERAQRFAAFQRPERAERRQVRAARTERVRAERPARAERQEVRAARTERVRAERPARVERQQTRAARTERVDNRAAERQQVRAARTDRVQNRAIDRQALRVNDRQAIRADRIDRRMERQELRADRQILSANRIGDRQALRAERQVLRADNVARVRTFAENRSLLRPLNVFNTSVIPVTTATTFIGVPLATAATFTSFNPLPMSAQYLYPDTNDYYYRYGNGYLYQVDRGSNLIAALLPLLFGGFMPGQYLPNTYMSSPSYGMGSYFPSAYGFNSFYPDYGNDCYRYGNGVIYEVDCFTGFVEDVIPLYAGGYGVGQMLPSAYSYYNVPLQYRSMYYDTPNYGYWYAPGAIYQYDRGSSLITSVASLLSPGFAIGQPMPLGYNAYNVPYGYRATYYDTPNAWYRYNNGYIYQVDPTTQLVTAIVASILT